MKHKTPLIAAGLIAYAVLGVIAAEYLAAALYFLLLKVIPQSIDSHTFLSLWGQLSADPIHRKKLQGAGVIACALVFVVPPLVATQLLRPRRSLHGDARFAYLGEVRKAGLHARRGILVGRDRGQYLMFDGQQFVLLAAPTRSGKGVGVVIPNLLNWPDSVVVLDIKTENYMVTSGFRGAHGQQVFLFNPFAEDFRSHRWNPLSGIRRDPNFRIGDILAIASVFWPSGSGAPSSNEAFFNDQAQNLFLGITLYLLDTPELPCTMGEVARQGSGNGQALDKHLRAILTQRAGGERPLSSACTDALNRFLSNSDNTLASIKASFEAPLLIFSNPIVDAATSGDDFDLRDLRRHRMSVYVGIPPNRLDDASRLLNVFFSQLIHLNTDKLPSQDPTLKYQCLLVLDEFTAIGRIPILAKAAAFIAGYNLRLLPIVQSAEQIVGTYGREAGESLMKNCDIRIIFPPNDIKDAEQVSQTLGYFTEKVVSTSESRVYGSGRGGNVSSKGESTSDQRRAVLLPQELRELPPDQQIILKSHTKPILCTKIVYYNDPVFTPRLLPPLEVPEMDMELHRARVERRLRTLDVDDIASLDLRALAINLDAIEPFTGDPDHPTDGETQNVVASYFRAIPWTYPGTDHAATQGAPASVPENAVLEH